MALDTYANLKTEIATWLVRTGDTTVTDRIDTFIDLAEDEFNSIIFHPLMNTDDTLSTVSSTETVSLPNDFRGLVTIEVDSTSGRKIDYIAPNDFPTRNASNQTGKPIMYTIIKGDTLRFAPTPDAVYSIDIEYRQDVPALNDSNTSNWLLAHYPSAYLYGALVQGLAFVQDEARKAAIKAGYAESLLRIKKDAIRWKKPPSGARPTILGRRP